MLKPLSFLAVRAAVGLFFALATCGAALLLHSPQAGSYPLFFASWLVWSVFALTIPDPPTP